MRIHKDFTGGNVFVKEIDGDRAVIENELRDTACDWFYFAFCVEGAQGREIRFELQKNRLGYWGPAVSRDLKNWHWLGSCDQNSFTYKFGEDEDRVYFAHHILYDPERINEFASSHGLTLRELCVSRHGRSVPYLFFGEGEKNIIITARHHACESTGSYVMEGFLREMSECGLPEGFSLFCVPFVDCDGVFEGDQGKARFPHDHNRDYTADEPSIYPEIAAIRDFAERNGAHLAFDFHSPWHKGGQNDQIFIVQNTAKPKELFDSFAVCLEKEITDGSMHFARENYHPAATGWNQPSPNFSFTMARRPENELAFSLENAYFGSEGNIVSASRLIELGRCFARAIKRFSAGRQ